MSERLIQRVWEGEPLPTGTQVARVLLVEDVPFGTGTASRRRFTVELERPTHDERLRRARQRIDAGLSLIRQAAGLR